MVKGQCWSERTCCTIISPVWGIWTNWRTGYAQRHRGIARELYSKPQFGRRIEDGMLCTFGAWCRLTGRVPAKRHWWRGHLYWKRYFVESHEVYKLNPWRARQPCKLYSGDVRRLNGSPRSICRQAQEWWCNPAKREARWFSLKKDHPRSPSGLVDRADLRDSKFHTWSVGRLGIGSRTGERRYAYAATGNSPVNNEGSWQPLCDLLVMFCGIFPAVWG